MSRNITIYKVKIQSIYTGKRIEGVDCNIYLFQSKESAYKFAYKKALEYYEENDYELPDEELGEKIKMRNVYTWSNNVYGEDWPGHLIEIEKTILRLDDDMIQEISIEL